MEKRKPKYIQFEESGHAVCDRHGFHSNWYVCHWRDTKKISCNHCNAARRRRQYAQGQRYQKKPSEKLLRWHKERTAICPKHGEHHKWRFHRGDSKLVCKPCHAQWSRDNVNRNWWKVRLQKIKSSAKARELEFNLTEEFIRGLIEKQQYKCALTGLSLDPSQASQISLDRIDSNKGYVPNNVWWTLLEANKMKLDFPLHRLVELCSLIVKTHGYN